MFQDAKQQTIDVFNFEKIRKIIYSELNFRARIVCCEIAKRSFVLQRSEEAPRPAFNNLKPATRGFCREPGYRNDKGLAKYIIDLGISGSLIAYGLYKLKLAETSKPLTLPPVSTIFPIKPLKRFLIHRDSLEMLGERRNVPKLAPIPEEDEPVTDSQATPVTEDEAQTPSKTEPSITQPDTQTPETHEDLNTPNTSTQDNRKEGAHGGGEQLTSRG